MIDKTMEPLICPQCGGQVDGTRATGDFVRCEYCNTQFHIGSGAAASETSSAAMPDTSSGSSRGTNWGGAVVLFLIVTCVVGFLAYTLNGVRQTADNTANTAKSAANDALSVANSIKAAANAMANAARQNNSNFRSPSPMTTPKKDAAVNK